MSENTDSDYPFAKGWMAGLLGEDPRACPYEKMTKEWREWQSAHGKAVEYRRCTQSTPTYAHPIANPLDR